MKSLLLVLITLYVRDVDGLNVVLQNGETNSTIEIEINANQTLKYLRQDLIDSKQISHMDTSMDKWRFLSIRNTDEINKNEDIADYVVPKSKEQITTINEYKFSGSRGADYVILVNLQNFSSKIKVKIFKGLESTTVNVDVTKKLSALREILSGQQLYEGRKLTFMSHNDDLCVSWRFVDRTNIITSDEVEQAKNIAETVVERNGETIIEIVNEYGTNMKTVYIFKGVDEIKIEISGTRLLSDLRRILTGNDKCDGQRYNFLRSNEEEDWIVLKKKANLTRLRAASTTLTISPDLIVTKGEERIDIIDNVLFNTSQVLIGEHWILCLEYVNQKGSPGIIGQRATEYMDNMGEVAAFLKVTKDVPADRKMAPVMLEHVQATNERILIMNNVILFENDTDIRFSVNTEPKTPFWIVVRDENTVHVTTRGDHGFQDYFYVTNSGGRAINVQGNEITASSDLENVKLRRHITVNLFTLINNNRRKRSNDANQKTHQKIENQGGNVASCGNCHENGKIEKGVKKPTGSGTDLGYKAGHLFATFAITFLVFPNSEVADKIVQRIALIEN